MLKKSIPIGLTLVSLMLGSAYAGGNDVPVNYQDPTTPSVDLVNTGVYVQGDIAYASTDWQDNFPAAGFSGNDDSSLAFDINVGYQWSRFLAAEVGSIFLDDVRFNRPFPVRPTVHSWAADAAGRIMLPIPGLRGLDAVFRGGIAYRNTRIDLLHTSGDWTPIFSAGGQYNFSENWFMDLQWVHLGEGATVRINNTTPNHIPAYNLFTIGAGYKFTF